jgi:hypothetical protein
LPCVSFLKGPVSVRFTGSEFDMMLRRSDKGWTEVVMNE